MRFPAFLVGGAALFFVSGCPDDDGGGGACSDYQPPASFVATAPAVSFARDVVPIFNGSCAFSDCHSSISRTALSLGDQNRIVPSTAHASLVGKPSRALPSMPYVTAGDPRQSFLMFKLDGSQCTLDARCTDGTCGQAMPRNGELLDLGQRDTIRRWIAQGAKND